mmetsp:Transcript_27718/g.62573  ORF Transcript_27718/g.62573 Transcript_27718/m.62573 type:complete len:195 (-) Transcript_27718:2-586(-)
MEPIFGIPVPPPLIVIALMPHSNEIGRLVIWEISLDQTFQWRAVVIAFRRTKPQEFRHHNPIGNMPQGGGTRGSAEHDDTCRVGREVELTAINAAAARATQWPAPLPPPTTFPPFPHSQFSVQSSGNLWTLGNWRRERVRSLLMSSSRDDIDDIPLAFHGPDSHGDVLFGCRIFVLTSVIMMHHDRLFLSPYFL